MKLPGWIVLSMVVFLMSVVAVWGDPGPVMLDQPVLQAFDAWRTEAKTKWVLALTGLGGGTFQIPASVLVALAVFWRSRRSGVFLAIAWGGSVALNEGLKILIARARPTLVGMVYQPRGLSFPSGHSQSSMAFALGLALVYWRLGGGRRRRVVVGLMALPLVVGLSRAYLGVHYPSDVVAGWSLGAFWVLLVDAWYERVDVRGDIAAVTPRERSSADRLVAVAVGSSPPAEPAPPDHEPSRSSAPE